MTGSNIEHMFAEDIGQQFADSDVIVHDQDLVFHYGVRAYF